MPCVKILRLPPVNRNRVAVVIAAAFFLFAAILVSVILYRSFSERHGRSLPEMLSTVDTLILSGDRNEALSVLKDARKKAVSTSQWISIAKREINLSELNQAEETIRIALDNFPVNDRLSAVLVYVLLKENKTAEAVEFLPFLKGTEFASLAAYTEIVSSMPVNGGAPDFSSMNPQSYSDAWKFSGNPVFRRDGALLYALEGNYRQAYDAFCMAPENGVRDSSSLSLDGDSYLKSLLAYDAGFFSAVPGILFSAVRSSGGEMAQDSLLRFFSPEEVLLAADSFYMSGDSGKADSLWKILVSSGEAVGPVPFFNHSVYAASWSEKRSTLEKCLSFFPDYYPAVAEYVRSAVPADSPSVVLFGGKYGFAEDALREAGFVSVAMEAAELNKPVTLPEAREVLDSALSSNTSDGDGKDLRLNLEEIRFLCFQNGKDADARHKLWNLLELYSGNRLVADFAVWLFCAQGDFNLAFEVLKDSSSPDPVYSGIQEAAAGNPDTALGLFESVIESDGKNYAAYANSAVILKKQGKYNEAADLFVMAGETSDEAGTKSRMYYEAAVVFELQKAYVRAVDMLRHAVSLDKDNYSAKTLLRRLESSLGN